MDMVIHKMLLTDENMQPIAVQIPYAEWLEIELLLGQKKTGKGNLNELSGTISINEDPVLYQRRIRDEWQ